MINLVLFNFCSLIECEWDTDIRYEKRIGVKFNSFAAADLNQKIKKEVKILNCIALNSYSSADSFPFFLDNTESQVF